MNRTLGGFQGVGVGAQGFELGLMVAMGSHEQRCMGSYHARSRTTSLLANASSLPDYRHGEHYVDDTEDDVDDGVGRETGHSGGRTWGYSIESSNSGIV